MSDTPKVCRFFQRGTCKKGDECNFLHVNKSQPNGGEGAPEGGKGDQAGRSNGKPREGVKGSQGRGTSKQRDVPGKPGKAPRLVVPLDEPVTSDELASLNGMFEGIAVANSPPGRSPGAHAYMRAERAVVTSYLVSRYPRALEVQGKQRASDAQARDICRRHLTYEDAGHIVCPANCVHTSRLLEGKYDTVIAVDVPLTPTQCRSYLSDGATGDARAREVILALHVHEGVDSVLGQQTAAWRSVVGALQPTFAEEGSVGRYSITTDGRRLGVERDHLWLQAQIAVCGVQGELVCKRGTYSIYRVTLGKPNEAQQVSDLSPAFAGRALGGWYECGDRTVIRAGSTVWCYNGTTWFVASAAAMNEACGRAKGRMAGPALRAKIAASVANIDGAQSAAAIAEFAVQIAAREAVAVEKVLDTPDPEHWASRIPILCDLLDTSKRTSETRLADWKLGRYNARQTAAVRRVVFATVAAVAYAALDIVDLIRFVVVCTFFVVATNAMHVPVVESMVNGTLPGGAFVREKIALELVDNGVPCDTPYSIPELTALVESSWWYGILVACSQGAAFAAIIALMRRYPALRGFRGFVAGYCTHLVVYWGVMLIGMIVASQASASPWMAGRCWNVSNNKMSSAWPMPGAAAQNVHPLRAAYAEDKFCEHFWHGPLPCRFSLPGHVSARPLCELAEGAELVVGEPPIKEDIENPKDMLEAVGIVFSGYLPSVALPCQQNLVVGACNRQLKKVPLPDMDYFAKVTHDYLAKVGSVAREYVHENFDAWNSGFPKARRAQHEVARAKMLQQLYTSFDIVQRKVFTKVEKIVRWGKGDYDPRVITGATDSFNTVFGPFFKAAKGSLAQVAETVGENVLWVTDQSASALGDWFDRATADGVGRAICGDDQIIVVNSTIVEADGDRHDTHMTEPWLEYKWELYSRLWHLPSLVRKYAWEAARKTVAYSHNYGVSWSHGAKVRSGDPDTKDGNSVCSDLVASVVERVVRAGLAGGKDVPTIVAEVQGEVLRLGYELTLKIHQDPVDATFLGGWFAPVDGKTYWLPLPGRHIVKLGWAVKRQVPTCRILQELAGVCDSYRDYRCVPFLRVFVRGMRRLLKDVAPRGAKRWQIEPRDMPAAPCADTWDHFYRRYGLTARDELEFAREIAQVDSLPFMLNSSCVRIMAEIDLS